MVVEIRCPPPNEIDRMYRLTFDSKKQQLGLWLVGLQRLEELLMQGSKFRKNSKLERLNMPSVRCIHKQGEMSVSS